jgi:hypothetical protein
VPEDKGGMKFASARQRRYMYAVVPEAAKKWARGRKTRPSDWRKRKPSRTYVSAVVAAGYKDHQRRDDDGKWTDGGVNAPDVSDVLDKIENGYGAKSPIRKVVDRAMGEINEIHGDGPLPKIKVAGTPKQGLLGEFRYSYVYGIDGIRLKNGTDAHMNMAHEFGHALDFAGISQDPGFATIPYLAALRKEKEGGELSDKQRQLVENSPMKNWWAAVEGSETYQSLRDRASRPSPVRGYLTYLNKPDEIWARSYAQYIGSKSPEGSAIKRDLRTMQQRGRDAANDPLLSSDVAQWPDDDFQPIAEAIDELFGGLGWLKN